MVFPILGAVLGGGLLSLSAVIPAMWIPFIIGGLVLLAIGIFNPIWSSNTNMPTYSLFSVASDSLNQQPVVGVSLPTWIWIVLGLIIIYMVRTHKK